MPGRKEGRERQEKFKASPAFFKQGGEGEKGKQRKGGAAPQFSGAGGLQGD